MLKFARCGFGVSLRNELALYAHAIAHICRLIVVLLVKGRCKVNKPRGHSPIARAGVHGVAHGHGKNDVIFLTNALPAGRGVFVASFGSHLDKAFFIVVMHMRINNLHLGSLLC